MIRYEPVVMDKSSTTPVHGKLILKNNRFLNSAGRKHAIALRYLADCVIEGNTSNTEIEIIKEP